MSPAWPAPGQAERSSPTAAEPSRRHHPGRLRRRPGTGCRTIDAGAARRRRRRHRRDPVRTIGTTSGPGSGPGSRASPPAIAPHGDAGGCRGRGGRLERSSLHGPVGAGIAPTDAGAAYRRRGRPRARPGHTLPPRRQRRDPAAAATPGPGASDRQRLGAELVPDASTARRRRGRPEARPGRASPPWRQRRDLVREIGNAPGSRSSSYAPARGRSKSEASASGQAGTYSPAAAASPGPGATDPIAWLCDPTYCQRTPDPSTREEDAAHVEITGRRRP